MPSKVARSGRSAAERRGPARGRHAPAYISLGRRRPARPHTGRTASRARRQPAIRCHSATLRTLTSPLSTRSAEHGAENAAPVDPQLNARLDAVCADGWAHWEAFERARGLTVFHPFVPADYDAVRAALLPLRAPGRRWLEWGSASGTLTVMAALLGFDACGIELDTALVEAARALAARHGADARFAAGSFLPAGYTYRAPDGDRRTGTLGSGPSGYLQLGRALDDFDVVFGYPWVGEAPVMRDLMRRYGRPDALLLLHDAVDGVRAYPGGREGPEDGRPGRARRNA